MQTVKQRIKQLLLLITTGFFTGVSLTSCEKELYEEGIKNSSRDLTVTHVSLSGLDKTTSSKINEKITLLKNLSKKTNSQGKFEYNAELDIYIDTENGRLVINNGKLYYTFPMFRKTEENLENIIFAPLASGEMETYFARYNVTPEVFDDLTITEIENLNPTFQRIDANSVIVYICTTINFTITTYPNCPNPGGLHYSPQGDVIAQCDGESVAYSYQFCSVSFGGGSATNGGDSGPGVSGPSDSGPTGNGGANPASGISTSPTNISEADLKKKKFIIQLTDGQSGCLDGLSDDAENAVLDLLNVELQEDCNENSYSEAQQFDIVENILGGICAAGNDPNPEYTPENYPGMDDGMPFEWWKDKEYIKANLRMPSDSDINGVASEPNALEVALFIVYPTAAFLHIRNSNLALTKSQELVIDGVLTQLHNGKADAYRHAFWNARDTADFGTFITKLFTDAHEWNSCNHPKESEMDFFNNAQGRVIGHGYNILTSDSTISNSIITAIYSGSLLYLTPLAPHDGNNILTNTNILPTNQ